MKMKRFRIIIVFLLILPELFAGNKNRNPEVVNGVLDLRKTDLTKSGVIRADGNWTFYWRQFIEPLGSEGSNPAYIPVPGVWKNETSRIEGLNQFGFGSYVLDILLPPGIPELSLRASEVYSGSSFYANGINIGFMGFPGANRYQTVLNPKPVVMTFPVSDTLVRLVIHISNFDCRRGGIRSSVELGLPYEMKKQQQQRTNWDFMLIGAFMIIGIYFLGMQFLVRQTYELFFALICLVMAFRLLVVSDGNIFPFGNIDGVSWLRLQLLGYYLLVPLFVEMIHYLFPIEYPKYFLRLFLWISVPFIALVMVAPASMFVLSLTPFNVFVSIVFLVNLYVLILAWIRGRIYAPGISIGMLFIFIGALNDILNMSDILETGFISQYTFFIFLLVYSLIFTHRLYRNMVRSEQLAAEVKQVNENLEEIVESRTGELKEKSRQIGLQKAQLEKRNVELRKAVNTRNRIFTIIGHDIRGPIGYSQQVLDMMLKNKDMSVRERSELLKLLHSTATATYNLLDNLLVWGRSEMGNLEHHPSAFRVQQLVKEVVSIMELGTREKSQVLNVDISSELMAYADPNQVQVVLRNLLSNSIKFTEEKGEISISASWDDTYKMVVIRVTDNGIGIPSVVRDKLFDPDEIITTKGTANEQGTGLGLKLSRELMELNKGFLSLEQTSFKGSSFIMGIPAEGVS
ncbi:MAG: ATP-binding protein [Bacteroidota bacterium]